jgi:hypothetical protein
VAFDDVSMPTSEHAAAILVGSWPAQSVWAWVGYSQEFKQAAQTLFKQVNTQQDIRTILRPMSGAFIDAAVQLEASREAALQNRIEGYRYLAKQAHLAANELHETKADLAEIVKAAEESIRTLRENAEQAKAAAAAVPGAAAVIDGQLQADIANTVATAKGEAQARDLKGAEAVAALSTGIGQWTAPLVNNILPTSGGGVPAVGNLPAAPPPIPATPAPQGGGPHVESAGHDYATNITDQSTQPQEQQGANPNQPGIQKPGAVGPNQAGTPPNSTTPSTSSGSSSPGSMIGKMLSPLSSAGSSGGGSSPASSGGGLGSGLGNFGSNPGGAQSGGLANPAPPGAGAAPGLGTGTGAGVGAGHGSGLAGLGSGIAESSARMASGAVNASAAALGTAGNVGNQVAQSAASAAAQAPAQAAAAANPAALTTPAAAAPAGAPMAMMPPGGGAAGGAPVTPVSGTPAAGPAAPTTPAAAQPVSSGFGGPAASAPTGAQVAPLAMPHSSGGIRAIGADGATGDVLFQQAMDAGHDVIAAMIAQTANAAHIGIDFAVSLIWERTGTVAAWMATSEGASYIPLGVRVPPDVRLAVTDPVVGRGLWEATTAAGGANPLEVVVRHAEAREMAAPGARVLAIASSLPMDQVMDWADAVRARAVGVDAKKLGPIDLAGNMAHRCAVAMPWEWQQANAFTEQDRLQIAARHMHMAATAGHLSGAAACERVMRLFEERKPIDPALWVDVSKERIVALLEYESAMRMRGSGGSEPARALATARAAEVIECLRHYDTAEGCADLLYATRLAGAPLSPAAAVTP